MKIKMKTCQNNPNNRWSFLPPRSFVAIALALIGVFGSLGIASTAQAVTLYATSFEQPTFQPGDQLLGLDGWSTAIPPFLNPAAAVITNAAAKSGKQSVEIRGANLVGSGGLTAPYDAIGSYRRPLDHTVSGNKTLVRVDANLLLKANKPKTPGEFFSLTIAARSGAGETLGEIGLASNGAVEAWSFGAIPGSPPAFTKPIRFNKWYHITMLHDFTNKTTSYFIDDHFLGSTAAASGPVPNVLLRGAMVVYARPDGGAEGGVGSVRSDYTARFDKFRLSVHSSAPEID